MEFSKWWMAYGEAFREEADGLPDDAALPTPADIADGLLDELPLPDHKPDAVVEEKAAAWEAETWTRDAREDCGRRMDALIERIGDLHSAPPSASAPDRDRRVPGPVV